LFFIQEVSVRFSGLIPALLLGEDGEMDTRILFNSVAFAKSADGAKAANDDYLAALMTAVSGSDRAQPEATEEVVERVAEELDPAVKPFFDRIVIIDGNRTITVEQGDSLDAYATAFYGDPLLSRSIYLANAGVLSDPDLLVLGQVVIIPDIQ
jgi:nucleoid-associated protein YgaU